MSLPTTDVKLTTQDALGVAGCEPSLPGMLFCICQADCRTTEDGLSLPGH